MNDKKLKEIEKRYKNHFSKINLERNDFLIPHIISMAKQEDMFNLRPEYQRRQVWNQQKKSRFIESLLMNIPIPPVFLFEHDVNEYEVMDGQQRITTIRDFFDNKFTLKGLKSWKELNDFDFSGLPPIIQKELKRRRISATVIEAESTNKFGEESEIRKEVFNRLNTGGVSLKAQELRNCNYAGAFNDLLMRLAANRIFTRAWGIPDYTYSPKPEGYPNKLIEDKYFKRMEDCELVLRFFSFEKYASATSLSMDRCMKAYNKLSSEELEELGRRFIDRITAAHSVFEKTLFRSKDGLKWKPKKQVYDLTLFTIKDYLNSLEPLIQNKDKIQAAIGHEFTTNENFYDTVIQQHQSIDKMQKGKRMLKSIIKKSMK